MKVDEDLTMEERRVRWKQVRMESKVEGRKKFFFSSALIIFICTELLYKVTTEIVIARFRKRENCYEINYF